MDMESLYASVKPTASIVKSDSIAVFTHGGVSTPVENPLVVHINGSDYYMGRKEVGPYIMVWPYQRPEKSTGGIF